MTLLEILKDTVSEAKTCILDNLDESTEYVDNVNPCGEKSLLLDVKAENRMVEHLQSSDIIFEILTEEKGLIKSKRKPEYLAIVDPIDGSANLKKGIPLVSIGIAAIPFKKGVTSDDVEVSIVDSIFTNERYIGIKGKGVTRNGKHVDVADHVALENAIVSFNTRSDQTPEFVASSIRTLNSIHDTRRTASPLLDLCWIAAGSLDGMVEIRNSLPIYHVSGTHMVFEAGGYVIDPSGKRYTSPLKPNEIMNFVAASSEKLAKQILNRFVSRPQK